MSPLNPEGKNEREPYVVTSKGHTAVAINAAAKAGEWIKSRQGLVKELNTKTSAQDLVTEVDKGVEQMIRRLILTHFPDHAILGEEGFRREQQRLPLHWKKLVSMNICGL